MANTLTNLIPSAYASLDVVSRELVGFIPGVTRDATVERAGVGQTVYSHIAPASTAADITPGQLPPDTGDQTIGSVGLAITKSRAVPIRWLGEESLGLNNGGAGQQSIFGNQVQQALRTLTNEIEADLAALQATTSRAYGTAATSPFGTAGDYTDAAQVRKILVDNGADASNLQLVIDTAAGANQRGKQSTYINNGTDSILRQGVLLDINGMAIRESAQVVTQTAGTMASATSTSAAFTVGQTVIPLATAGTGVVAAGDVVTFANDTNKYVVASVSFAGANPASGDSITLAAPGLRKAQGAATRAITVTATAARNVAFASSAIILAQRLPALPSGGDSAVDRTTITDPRSGLTFEMAMYAEYRRMHIEISASWGVKNVKPEHTALLLG
jgi:hypothetical protein